MANFGDVDGKTAGAGRIATQSSQGSNPHGEPGVAILRETARQEGYRAGFESGRADGLKAGREAAGEEARELALRLGQAISRIDDGVASMERDLADSVLFLALEVARKVVGQTVNVQPEIVLESIRAALAQMPAQHAVVRLNADDAALVRKYADDLLARGGHRIQEDSQLERGDVVIDGNGAHLDSRLSTRWRRVVASLDQGVQWIAPADTERP